MNTKQPTPKSPIFTALLLALPLSLLGGIMVFIMTSNLGNALVAAGMGLAIGLVIYLVSTSNRRHE